MDAPTHAKGGYFPLFSNIDFALEHRIRRTGESNVLEGLIAGFLEADLQVVAAFDIALTGTTRLPKIRSTGRDAGLHLQIEYLRRKASANPGLTYTPQFLSDLGTAWQDFTGTETVQSIDTVWERVTVDDTTTGQTKRFGRVRVVTVP